MAKRKKQPKAVLKVDAARVTKARLRQICCISMTSLNAHLIKSGAPKPDKDGLYDPVEVKEFIVKERGDNDEGRNMTLGQERIKKTRVERKIKEAELKKLMGQLLEVDEVVMWIREHMGGVRKKLLSMATSLAPRLARKPKKDIARIIDDYVEDILRDLQEYEPEAKGGKAA